MKIISEKKRTRYAWMVTVAGIGVSILTYVYIDGFVVGGAHSGCAMGGCDDSSIQSYVNIYCEIGRAHV